MARSGARLDAAHSALALLHARLWPLWRHTPHRTEVVPGDAVAVYLAGAGCVIARARIERVGRWTRELRRCYPLMLDGVPAGMLHLAEVTLFEHRVNVRERLARLSFVQPDLRGWGSAFSKGLRLVPATDFAVLTAVDVSRPHPAALALPTEAQLA